MDGGFLGAGDKSFREDSTDRFPRCSNMPICSFRNTRHFLHSFSCLFIFYSVLRSRGRLLFYSIYFRLQFAWTSQRHKYILTRAQVLLWRIKGIEPFKSSWIKNCLTISSKWFQHTIKCLLVDRYCHAVDHSEYSVVYISPPFAMSEIGALGTRIQLIIFLSNITDSLVRIWLSKF